jgi:hypothetical protein
MTFDELIDYCDSLDFLKRVDIPFEKSMLSSSGQYGVVIVNNPNRVVYEFIHPEEFDICFYRGLPPFFIPTIRNQYSLYYFDHPPTFEQFFEKLSEVGKQKIIYHLDLFNKVQI